MASVYAIQKGINRPIIFKGLQGQWIGWLAGVPVALLLTFAILYIFGVPSLVCMLIIVICGGVAVSKIIYCNKVYGMHGLMKKNAAKKIPKVLTVRTRKYFMQCKEVRT